MYLKSSLCYADIVKWQLKQDACLVTKMAAINEDTNGNRKKSNSAKSKTDNVIKSIAPVLFMENCFGIFRFRVMDNDLAPATGAMKILGLVIPIVVGVIFAAVFEVDYDLIDLIEDMPPVVILIQYISSAIMTSCLLNKANIRIVTLFADLDRILHLNTCNEFYKKSKTRAIIALAVIAIIHLISSASDFLLQGDSNDFVGEIHDVLKYSLNFVQDVEILIFF